MNTQQKKILTISAVVLFHAVVITLMLAQHGCKSDGQKGSAPDAVVPVQPAATPAPVVVDNSNLSAPTRPVPVAPVMPTTPPPTMATFTEPLGPTPEPISPTPPAASGPSITYVVASKDNLTSIAKKNGVTVPELLAANTDIKLTKDTVLRPNMKLTIPNHTPSAAAATPATASDERTYKVMSGDTLGKIAQKNGTTIAALKAANGIAPADNMVRIGQTLKLPAASSASPSSATATSSATGDTGAEYIVVSNDTPEKIARKVGVKTADLMKANNITPPGDSWAKSLRPGQKLKLPEGAHTPSATSSPSSPAGTAATPSTSITPVTITPMDTSPSPAPTPVTGVAVPSSGVPVTPVTN